MTEGIATPVLMMAERSRWWSELLYYVWVQRHGAGVDSHSEFQLNAPPTTVLECPRTGILAHALWLIYR